MIHKAVRHIVLPTAAARDSGGSARLSRAGQSMRLSPPSTNSVLPVM